MKRMRITPGCCLAFGLFLIASPPAPASEVFPYDAKLEVLPNGLKIVSVPVNPSKEISYFTIFRSGGRAPAAQGDAAGAELYGRIGAETRRIVAADFYGDFISFCGREYLAEVVRVEAARVSRLSLGEGGAPLTPADTILLVAGDINRDELLPLLRSAYAPWQGPAGSPGPTVNKGSAPSIGQGFEPPVPGRVRLVFRGPSFSDRDADKAALDLLASSVFSAASPLGRKLILEEGRCLSLEAVCEDRRSSGLFILQAEARDERDRAFIESAIEAELARLRTEPLPSRILAAAVSNKKSTLAVSIAAPGEMARVLAHYLGLSGDPGTVDRLFALYEKITPVDVRTMVRKYLGPENRLAATDKGGRR